MKNLTKLITAVFLLSTFVLPVMAVTQDEIDGQLLTLEDVRIQKLENELGITVPEISDNPNHVITFKDPSEDKGVKLEIDGQGYKTVKSPYTLPSLGIGRHILTFKFTDSEEAPQTLEKEITIIPRPPIIDAPEKIENKSFTFKGTALSGSTVELYLVSGTKNYKAETQVSNDGTWSKEFANDFDYGIYSIVGLTKKNGFASIFSETIVFELSNNNGAVVKKTEEKTPIQFTFKDLLNKDIIQTVKDNPDLGILALILVCAGIVLTTLVNLIINRSWNKSVEGLFSQKLSNPASEKVEVKEAKLSEPSTNRPLTLREKFEQKGVKMATSTVTTLKEEVKENEAGEEVKETTLSEKKVTKKAAKGGEKEVKEEVVTEEKVLTKDEFLKEFKEQDPDDKKGEEVKENEPEEKKNDKTSLMNSIKISLTSKPKKEE